MKEYAPENLRNVGLFSHEGAGKTTLVESLLFRAGAISRRGTVEDGNATTDTEPEEVRRHMSVSLGVAPLDWQGTKINLIDAPGYADFYGEVAQALRVSDAALILIDGVAGVEVGTDAVWKSVDQAGAPRLVVVNRLDRENADYGAALESLRSRYGKHLVPLVVPVGKSDAMQGVIDVLADRMYVGDEGDGQAVPDEMRSAADQFREMLIESACELDDVLVNKYLEGEEITADELRSAVRVGVKKGELVPVLAASATRSMGLVALLQAIVDFLPSPLEVSVRTQDGGTSEPDARLAALVFKTVSDANIGRLSYVRVFSGTLAADSHVWNVAKAKDERVGQVFVVRGKTQEPAQRLVTGDIGVLPKLADTVTGETLGARDHAQALAGITYPQASYFVSVHPKTRNDVDKLSTSMARLQEEDPSLHLSREPSTGEVILSGLGDTHMDVAVQRLERKFGVHVTLEVPRVAYRETVSSHSAAEGRHVRQSGGHGQYGVVHIELDPTERGAGFEFADKVVGGVVPKQYIPAVEKGVRETMEQGVIAGYPVVDVRCALVFGKYHPVDSSEAAFKTAGSVGFKAAFAQANPILLEPVMQVQITVPSEYAGDVVGDLNTRRAHIQGMNPEAGSTLIEARVPQSEMLRYATVLRSLTQGRGTYAMQFSHYDPVPAHVQAKIVEERKKEFAHTD